MNQNYKVLKEGGRLINSMTGYGCSKATSGSVQIFVEIKTVNHRFFEIVFRIPRQLMVYEDRIRKLVQSSCSRGRAEVFITLSGEGLVKKKLVVHWDVIDQLDHAAKLYDSAESLSFADIMQHDAAVSFAEIDDAADELSDALMEAVKQATEALCIMRETEGAILTKDLEEQASLLQQRLSVVKQHTPKVIEQFNERLTQKLQEAVGAIIDQNRLLTEITILTDKLDIHEEIARLGSHIQQFNDALQEVIPIGRKADFLIQEMNREVNTIGSKCNDINIAKEVVEMKTILEKMKEQVQNIE